VPLVLQTLALAAAPPDDAVPAVTLLPTLRHDDLLVNCVELLATALGTTAADAPAARVLEQAVLAAAARTLAPALPATAPRLEPMSFECHLVFLLWG
jgi:hypothetical protein